MNQTPTVTAAITQSQLADLAGLSRPFISQHLDDLPESFLLRDGSNGRPPRCWTIEQIIQYVLDKTAGLTELECRLRIALLDHSAARPEGQPRIIDTPQGAIVVPSKMGDLPADVRELVRQEMDADLTRLRNRRHRSPTKTEE